MGKDKKSKGKKDKAMYRCKKCDGVSKKKKDVCKPARVAAKELSGKDKKRKPCND